MENNLDNLFQEIERLRLEAEKFIAGTGMSLVPVLNYMNAIDKLVKSIKYVDKEENNRPSVTKDINIKPMFDYLNMLNNISKG